MISPMAKMVKFLLCFALIFSSVLPVSAAENLFIDGIQKRGVLKVGIPSYNTPPAYYIDKDSEQLKGYDIDIARDLANELGVDVQFDRTSEDLNTLVRRVGAGDFDMAIGKLGLNYKRMFNAYPVHYLNFRHALLANRTFVSSLSSEPGNSEFAEALKNSNIKIASLAKSIWEVETATNFPNATYVGYPDWAACQQALFDGDVDAIYRDMTEIKPLVYAKPELIIDYVPILFDDIVDKKSIYLSKDGYVNFTKFIKFYISKEWGQVKSDSDILEEYKDVYSAS
ncbi:MAG: hypothetical protein CMN91_06595 [Synechococcus sp. ARS1019]|nr:hypothetical protein [Synechococcus sp. ARS1019]